MDAKPKVIVIGAGIGGLTTAIALRIAGHEVEVFERAEALQEVGAGIGLWANAVRVLNRLGVMRQVVDRGAVIKEVVSYRWDGDVLGRMSISATDVPNICLHRADLQEALLSVQPCGSVHVNEEFVRFERGDGLVTAHFARGRSESGHALIGADGLRSRVRAQLLEDGEPVFRGYHCWRGVCDYPATERLTESFGRGLRLGLVPIGRRGTAWWCTANAAPSEDRDPARIKSQLLEWFGAWHHPIPEVLGRTDPAAIIQTPICDRPPVAVWSKGACTLLGDAAHPTTPNLGQGGCMAIEDAAVLARCATAYPDLPTAFRRYEQVRFARTARVTTLSRYSGVLGQWENPALVWLRNGAIRLTPSRVLSRSQERFILYDPWTESPGDGA